MPRLLASVFAVFLLLALSLPAASAAGLSYCDDTFIPVGLTPGAAPIYLVHGRFCSPLPGRSYPLQILVPGATYDGRYWDFPTTDGESYSYVQDALARGYATLAIDRIGTGKSSYPPAAEVTLQADAYTLHQVVQFARRGQLGNGAPSKIYLVGHSLGSAIAMEESAAYADADALVLTGVARAMSPAVAQIMAGPSPFVPAGPAGYVTTAPGMRAAMFYNAADASQDVINEDEATKALLSGEELNEMESLFLGPAWPALIAAQTLPIDNVIGQADALFDATQPFGDAAYILPQAGHDVNLHLNHQLWQDQAAAWLAQH